MNAIKLSAHHGERSASLFRKSAAAPLLCPRERLMALALVAEGRAAKVVAQRLGRHNPLRCGRFTAPSPTCIMASFEPI